MEDIVVLPETETRPPDTGLSQEALRELQDWIGKAVSDVKEQIQEVKANVNQRIMEDHPLRIKQNPLQEAIDGGARALFGEKYGEVCPANWHEGSSTIKPDLEGSKDFFSKEYS